MPCKSLGGFFTPLKFFVLISVCIPGCPVRNNGKFVAVRGRVAINGVPLTSGAVTFHPDTDKGNQSLHIPVGAVDAQGEYEVSSATQKGAPAGWYKIAISAQEPIDPKNPYAPPRNLINPKFADVTTSGLAVEVKDNAPAGTYDFQVTK